MSRKLIDRDALLEKAKQEQRFYKDEYDAMESGYLDEEREIMKEAYSTMTDCVSLINNAPTIDAVEVKHGEWMEEGSSCSYIFHCSVCGGVAYFVHGKGRGRNIERRFCGYRYCPNCGAKMDGERRDPCS